MTDRFQLIEATVKDIQQALARGETTAEALTLACLERIGSLDGRLNSMARLNPGAVEAARRLDALQARGGWGGPLHGVPVVIKDNIDLADMPTTAGSIALADSRPTEDAPVVARLLRAGAVILGQTNLSELCTSMGWCGHSSLSGLVGHPYRPGRAVTGSSSGSAAAVTASLAVLSLGTDTSGSVRCPASVSGLVGIRPTTGTVPVAGVVPVTLSTDTVGPICRTVADAALLLGVIQGLPEPGIHTDRLKPGALRGARLGLARRFTGACPEVDAVFEAAVADLARLGAEVIDPVPIPDPVYRAAALAGEVIKTELKSAMDGYLSRSGAFHDHPDRPRDLAGLVARLEEAGDWEAGFDVNPGLVNHLHRALRSGPRPEAGCRLDRLGGLVARLFTDLRLDALVYPTEACLAQPVYGGDEPGYVCQASDPYRAPVVAALSGRPAITVPAGLSRDGLPIGLEFMGRPGGEADLIGLAFDYEHHTNHRRPPDFQ